MTKETEKNELNRIMAELTAIDELIAETELKAADYIKLISAAAGSNDDVIKAVTALFEDPASLQAAHEAPADLASSFIDRHGGIEAFKNELNTQREEYTGKMQQAAAALDSITNAVKEITESESYKLLVSAWTSLKEYYEAHKDEQYPFLANRPADLQELAPFIEAEIKAREIVEPGEEALYTQDVILDSFTIDGRPIEDTPFRQIIDGALARKAEFEKGAALVANIEHIITHPADRLIYPLDKPNSVIWNMLENAAPGGQIKMEINTAKRGSAQEAVIKYALYFEEIEEYARITKQLTPFDKRVYVAIAGLFNAGNDKISLSQIYETMGNRSRPSPASIKKINDSITKMSSARVLIDNENETQKNQKYPAFKYDASLLPLERLSLYFNGGLSESAIHLFREPPLISFARGRQQITTIGKELLESGVNKTDGNLRIEDYLIERIARIKAGGAPPKIKYSTIFDHCNINTSKKKERAISTIERYLKHYASNAGNTWIKSYTMSKDGITIEP